MSEIRPGPTILIPIPIPINSSNGNRRVDLHHYADDTQIFLCFRFYEGGIQLRADTGEELHLWHSGLDVECQQTSVSIGCISSPRETGADS